MRFQKTALFSVALLLAGTVQARDYDLLLQAGIDAGGDDLFSATYTNGDTVNISGGDMFQMGVGTTFKTAPELLPALETQLSVGYKFDRANAENGSATWGRFPIEALEFYTTPAWRFGGGLTYHLSPKLKGSGVASNASVDFDDALGIVFEVDYILGANSYIGGRITRIDYTISNTNLEFSGNSIGITFGWRP